MKYFEITSAYNLLHPAERQLILHNNAELSNPSLNFKHTFNTFHTDLNLLISNSNITLNLKPQKDNVLL